MAEMWLHDLLEEQLPKTSKTLEELHSAVAPNQAERLSVLENSRETLARNRIKFLVAVFPWRLAAFLGCGSS